MNNKSSIALFVAITLAIALIGGVAGSLLAPKVQSGALGGAQLVQNSNPIFTNGLRGGTATIVQGMDSSGNWVGPVVTASASSFTGNFTLGSGGTAQSLFKCQTSTVDPSAFPATTTFSGAIQTSQVSFPGALATDRCGVILSGTNATATLIRADCAIYGAGTSTLRLYNIAAQPNTNDIGAVSTTMCIAR